MKYERIKKLKEEKFRRLTVIRKRTFEKIYEILKEADEVKRAKGGRKNKLSMEDMILMTLEYWRENRTYFHTAQSYGLSESSAYKNIKWIENVLIKSKVFSLPGKKELQKDKSNTELILIDATETPIERPKKESRLPAKSKI